MGLDIGTTGCKAVTFDLSGNVLSSDYRSYETCFPAPGQCELDTEEVWRAVKAVIQGAARPVDARDPVEAIGISTLGDSLTLLDHSGRPLSRTVLGAADRRAIDQAHWLEKKIGREKLFQMTGAPPHAFCVIPKILWFREHQPEIFKRTAKFSGLQEIVHLRLGLSPTMDYSLAGRTMLLDIRCHRPAEELYAEAGLDGTSFFPLGSAAQVVGHAEGSAATELSLRGNVAVVVGGFDQSCCALGAGVVQEGSAALSVGTLEAITPVFKDLRLDQRLLTGNHGCIPGLVDGYFTSLAYVTTSGSVVKWYRDSLCSSDVSLGDLMRSVPESPSGLYVLPYFAGTGTPWLDETQAGMMFGLNLETTKAQILKGILEGIAFEIKLNIDSLRQASIPIERLRAIGGGARSDAWMQLKSDIAGVPIERTLVTEAGCLGAAFMAGMGIGRYSRLEDIKGLVSFDRVFEPRVRVSRSYEPSYAAYIEIRKHIVGLDLRVLSSP